MEVHGGRFIVPTAADAETILPDMPTPSFPEMENAPSMMGGGVGRSSGNTSPELPRQVALTSRLF